MEQHFAINLLRPFMDVVHSFHVGSFWTSESTVNGAIHAESRSDCDANAAEGQIHPSGVAVPLLPSNEHNSAGASSSSSSVPSSASASATQAEGRPYMHSALEKARWIHTKINANTHSPVGSFGQTDEKDYSIPSLRSDVCSVCSSPTCSTPPRSEANPTTGTEDDASTIYQSAWGDVENPASPAPFSRCRENCSHQSHSPQPPHLQHTTQTRPAATHVPCGQQDVCHLPHVSSDGGMSSHAVPLNHHLRSSGEIHDRHRMTLDWISVGLLPPQNICDLGGLSDSDGYLSAEEDETGDVALGSLAFDVPPCVEDSAHHNFALESHPKDFSWNKTSQADGPFSLGDRYINVEDSPDLSSVRHHGTDNSTDNSTVQNAEELQQIDGNLFEDQDISSSCSKSVSVQNSLQDDIGSSTLSDLNQRASDPISGLCYQVLRGEESPDCVRNSIHDQNTITTLMDRLNVDDGVANHDCYSRIRHTLARLTRRKACEVEDFRFGTLSDKDNEDGDDEDYVDSDQNEDDEDADDDEDEDDEDNEDDEDDDEEEDDDDDDDDEDEEEEDDDDEDDDYDDDDDDDDDLEYNQFPEDLPRKDYYSYSGSGDCLESSASTSKQAKTSFCSSWMEDQGFNKPGKSWCQMLVVSPSDAEDSDEYADENENDGDNDHSDCDSPNSSDEDNQSCDDVDGESGCNQEKECYDILADILIPDLDASPSHVTACACPMLPSCHVVSVPPSHPLVTSSASAHGEQAICKHRRSIAFERDGSKISQIIKSRKIVVLDARPQCLFSIERVKTALNIPIPDVEYECPEAFLHSLVRSSSSMSGQCQYINNIYRQDFCVYDERTASQLDNSPAIRLALLLLKLGAPNVTVILGGFQYLLTILNSCEISRCQGALIHHTGIDADIHDPFPSLPAKMCEASYALGLADPYYSSVNFFHQYQPSCPSRILSFLYLGDRQSASDYRSLETHQVTRILRICADEDAPSFYPCSIVYHKVELEDEETSNLLQYFDETYSFIENARVSHRKVLVHCYAGVSRSASVVIAYMMKRFSLGFEEAFQRVRQSRACVNPNPGFVQQLRMYESIIAQKTA